MKQERLEYFWSVANNDRLYSAPLIRELLNEIKQVEAENARLREALRGCHIQMIAMGNDLNWDGVKQVYVDAINAARAALAGNEQPT